MSGKIFVRVLVVFAVVVTLVSVVAPTTSAQAKGQKCPPGWSESRDGCKPPPKCDPRHDGKDGKDCKPPKCDDDGHDGRDRDHDKCPPPPPVVGPSGAAVTWDNFIRCPVVGAEVWGWTYFGNPIGADQMLYLGKSTFPVGTLVPVVGGGKTVWVKVTQLPDSPDHFMCVAQ